MNDSESQSGVVVYRSIEEKKSDEAYHKMMEEHPEAMLGGFLLVGIVAVALFFREFRKAKR